MKFLHARRITLTVVALMVLVALIWHTGSGTPSSFSWKEIAAICPLGVVETFVATWNILPRALITLLAIVVVVMVLGKIFCAWICPVPPLQRFFSFGKKQDKLSSQDELDQKNVLQAQVDDVLSNAKMAEKDLAVVQDGLVEPDTAIELSAKTCDSNCSSCAQKRAKLDSRHAILGGALLSSAIFGFPVFCLLCPVGLSFASVIALWRLVGFNEPSWSLILFPAILVIELLLLRKWCHKFCPLGAVMSLLSIPNRLFRPVVNESKCLRSQDKECSNCVASCEEGLDPHYLQGMHECTKCGACKDNCPGKAISFPPRLPQTHTTLRKKAQ